jgi:hypothetical protein
MSQPATDPKSKKVHGVGQKMAIGANVLLTVALAGAIVVMVNYLAARHAEWFWPPNWFTSKTTYRFDWTRSAYYKLSEKSKDIVRKLAKPIEILVFFQLMSDSDARMRNDIENLLKEYEPLTKNLKVQFIDVMRDPMARMLIEKHQISSANTVAVLCGDKKKYLSESDIMEFTGGGHPMMPEPQRPSSFKGESAITGAILAVTEEKQRKVCFLVGHGEKDPDEFEEMKGCSMIASRLKQDNLLVERLKLAEKHKIPDDCDVLVIAGPTKRLTQEELELVGKFLDNRGRLIVMLDPLSDSGLEPLLEKWNVKLDNNMIMARVSIMGLREGITFDAQAGEYGAHPIVDKLKDIITYFPRARSLETVESGPGGEASTDKPKTTALIKTPDAFWGETDFRALERREARMDAGADKQGPLTVAVAVERGGNVSGVEVGSSRLVVIGTSSFLINRYAVEGANTDFFLNSVNWLLQREQASLGISPKTPEEFRFHIVGRQFMGLVLSLILGIPGAVTAAGIAVWLRRRR